MPRRVWQPTTEAVAAASAFADSIAEGVVQRDRSGAAPHEEMARFDASGLLGITVPHADGGPGLGPSTLAEVTRVIAAVDPAIAQTPQAHYLFLDTVALLGTDAQKRRLLGEVLAGNRIGNALAERGTTHAQDLQTRLGPDEAGRIRLSGRKYYCTGTLTARWIAVTALDEHDRLVVAFVGRHDDGVTVTEDWNVMGQRATVSGTTDLDDVIVDPELVLPYWTAFAGPQALGSRAQLVHAAIEVGIAGGALRDARAFLRDKARPFFEAVRGGWVQKASEDPHSLLRYGRLATQVRAAEATLQWAGARARRDRPEPVRRRRRGPRLARGRPGQGLRLRGGGDGGLGAVRPVRGERRRRQVRPRPSLAQRPDPQHPRPGRLEVPPRGAVRGQWGAAAQSRPAVARLWPGLAVGDLRGGGTGVVKRQGLGRAV